MWDVHRWCPACGVSEAFHPEACPITPQQWVQLAHAQAWNLNARVGMAIFTRHRGGREVLALSYLRAARAERRKD